MHNIFLPAVIGLLPVARHLRGCHLVCPDPDFCTRLAAEGLTVSKIGVTAASRMAAMQYGRHLLAAVPAAFPAGMLDKAVEERLSPALPNPAIPKLFDVVTVSMLLDQVKIDLCLVHDDIQVNLRLVALWARANQVPCLHIPHSVYQPVNRTEPGTDVHDLLTASHLAAHGPYQRDWYLALGFPADRIRITGSPRLDAWATNEWNLTRETARAALGLETGRPVVTYAATWGQSTNMAGHLCQLGLGEGHRCYLAFLEAVADMDVQVILKLHPHAFQKTTDWHTAQAERRGVACLPLEDRLPEALWASDLLLAYGGSNVLIEGSFIPDLRLVTVRGYDHDPEIAKVETIDAAAFRAVLDGCLSLPAPDTADFRARYAGPADGDAGRRVAEFARELMGE